MKLLSALCDLATLRNSFKLQHKALKECTKPHEEYGLVPLGILSATWWNSLYSVFSGKHSMNK